MKRILTVLLAILLFLAPISTVTAKTDATNPTNALAGLLYGHLGTENHFICTTFTFAHDGNKYELGTASHCVSGDIPAGVQFGVVFDEHSKKEYPAKVMAVGGIDSEIGDVAVLEIETTDTLPVAPLSNEEVQVGDPIYYVGGAEALGKQYYIGLVAATKVNVPKTEGGQGAPKGWNDTMLLELAGGPGASGSGIRSAKTGQIVAILVGHPPNGQGIIIAVRIEQLQALWYNCQHGYKLANSTCGPIVPVPAPTENIL